MSRSTITGNDVRALRTALGLSASALAAVLGVSLSTVYRWEGRGDLPVPMEPLQAQLLTLTRVVLLHTDGAVVGEELMTSLALRGPLYALYALLHRGYTRGFDPAPGSAPDAVGE